ncbi:MAG TPA: endolytic transglycosylase MltG [Nitrospirota bacterium]
MKISFLSMTKAAVAVVLLAVAALSVHTALFLTRPASSQKEMREILITDGSSFRSVAADLKKNGVITSSESFIILGKLTGVTRKIRSGFYQLDTGMKPMDIIKILKKGRIVEYEVVVPEGWDMEQVAQALQDSGVATKSDFLKKAFNAGYIHSLGLEGNSLEGYLFPATYFLPKGITLDGIIKQMVNRYRQVFNKDLKARAAELGMSELQVLTLASLIEKEARLDSERLLISAVFHNRIKQGIPLQCDPCVIYALQRNNVWHGDLNKKNMRYKDPYNTYVYRGLPPGPIANPGKPSIIAALYPADVEYIYFVSQNDGTHYFSNTLSEHNKAVKRYLAARMENITSAVKPVLVKAHSK